MPNDGLEGRAYVYAHEVLGDLGIIKALAQLHQIGMSDPDNKPELRGVVQGAYRTVGIGGALAARFVQAHEGPPEEISRAYWSFVNESSVRQIASDMSSSLLPDEDAPVEIVKIEFRALFQRGYEIGNLHAKGQQAEAFELWRAVMKAPLGQGA